MSVGEMLSVSEIQRVVSEAYAAACDPLTVLWLYHSDPREVVGSDLKERFSGLPIVVMRVRESGFHDANTVLMDVVKVINRNKEECAGVLEAADGLTTKHLLLLVSKNDLRVPQSSSPVRLPEWYPGLGGQTVMVTIRDISHADVRPLNGSPEEVQQLAAGLHNLEAALIRRMQFVCLSDRGRVNALTELWKQELDPAAPELLGQMAAWNESVRNPGSFRPSRREERSLVARLWRIQSSHTPEKMQSARAVASALDIPAQGEYPRESLAAVLGRPTSVPEPPVRLARNVLMTVNATCQFLTAAAHADAYGQYSPKLISSTTRDLWVTMRETAAFMDRLTAEGTTSQP